MTTHFGHSFFNSIEAVKGRIGCDTQQSIVHQTNVRSKRFLEKKQILQLVGYIFTYNLEIVL